MRGRQRETGLSLCFFSVLNGCRVAEGTETKQKTYKMLHAALVVLSRLYSLLEIIILPEAESGAAGAERDGRQWGQ